MVWLQDGTVAGLGRSNCWNSCGLMNAPLGYRKLPGLSAPNPRSCGSKCASEGVRYGFSGHRIVRKWLRNNVALVDGDASHMTKGFRAAKPRHMARRQKIAPTNLLPPGLQQSLSKDVGGLSVLAMSSLCQICSKEPMKYRCPSCGIYR
jgi:hypothetical protein